MEFMKDKYLSCVFISFVVASGCVAAPPGWNGTWKLNESKSSVPGPSFSITISPTGEYVSDSGTYKFSFRCDRREYPTTTNRTISCSQTSPSVIAMTYKENGVKVGTAHWELSADGEMLTIKRTSIQTEGSVNSKENVYSRTTRSVGFAGGWRNSERLESTPQLLLALSGRSLHIAFSESGQYADLPLDGSDAPMHGPGIPQALTMAIRPNGPRVFLTLKKIRGQVINQGTLTLSADGRSLIEEYWRPDRPEQRALLTYERQEQSQHQ